MKLIKKLLAVVALCVCCIALAASAGCQSSKCTGIIDSYSFGDIDIKIEISETHEGLYFYPSLLIYQSTLKEYNCSSVNQLLINEDYAKNKRRDYVLTSYQGDYIFPKAFLNVNGDRLIYFLLYEGMDYSLEQGLPDSFYIISDPINYIGSIKFN